ncbi:glycosyltransferase family 2 protein [Prevotella sp. E13-27]|uniref:glycosyltransferase family 2 protein n=1 Tax=Prevotella sp. E13-27 TaxID=2938122 RepID=UPI00200B14D6|nr:glycosyltransferase family 2 protein [Prevotella sp. E13-27]MCK8623774.1 glycosyltransferase family 2 protein [Prevotella sp. E13-27]
MESLKIAFWACLVLVFYTYLGYGILLFLLLKLKQLFCKKEQKPVLPADESQFPDVTLMICAFNEEEIIKEKMENIRQLDYPKDKLCVMWVTDGSSDHSNELLSEYGDEITLVFSPERRGKAAAMQHGLQVNKSEYVVFTDANTMLNPGSIKEIVRLFMREDVGCVSGEKRVAARHEGQAAAEGEGIYWKYESTLKRWDSALYSAMGAAGELFAVRMSVYEAAPSNALLDDFMISMLILKKGYKIAYTSDAYAMEYGSANMEEESKRKRRIAAGGLQSIWWLRSLMNPFKYPITSFLFVSHRVLRWSITPFALLALIPLNVALVMMKGGTVYTVIWILQILFYLSAFMGYLMASRGKKNKLLYVPYYFLFMNINVFRGISYLRSHKSSGAWEKAKRG